jgi:PAS domain-containing protein
LPQLLMLTSLSNEGRRLKSRYLDDGYGRLHISVRIKNSPSVPITDTIEAVRSTAESVMEGHGRVTVTGDISVFGAQASALVRSQIRSLAGESGYRGLLEVMSEAVAVSKDGGIVDANPGFASLAGLDVSELIGMTIEELAEGELNGELSLWLHPFPQYPR